MVLGLGLKKKEAIVKVKFQIQVHEIKPWRENATASRENIPLLMQWHRGDNRSGRTRSAVPKLEDGGKIVFNDSFQLPAKLVWEPTTRTGPNVVANGQKFQKKTITFILQEATTNLQLAQCVMDLAKYGDLQSSVSVSIPLVVGNKNAFGGLMPLLFLTIGPLGKEERRFVASHMSFKSLTPRGSFLKALGKAVNVSNKLRVEPTLDEDTRRSIVASLMSSDEDDLSIESFTDDESTPEDSTPKSTCKDSNASMLSELEMPGALALATPLESLEVVALEISNLDILSTLEVVGEIGIESPTKNTSHDRPMLTKHSIGKVTQSPTIVAIDETIERSHVPTKHSVGKAAKSLTIPLVGQTPCSSTIGFSSTNSIAQLSSKDLVHESSKIIEDFSTESTTNPSKILQSTSDSPLKIESQLSTMAKQPPFIEWDKATLTTLATGATNNHGSTSSSSRKANKILVSSSEHPQVVASKLIDKVINSSSLVESKKPGENFGTKHVHLPTPEPLANKELLQESTIPLPQAPTKVATIVALASTDAMSRTFKSFQGSSFDYMFETSEDSLESSNGDRSLPQTPLHDQPHVFGCSLSNSESSMITKHGESKDMDSSVESNIFTKMDKKWDESKALHNNSSNVKQDILGEVEGKKKVVEKHEELVEYSESVLGSARASLAKIEKRALEELRMKITNVEAKYSTESQKVENLQGELCDVSAMEVSLYCVVAEHTGSLSHKFYTPARRLARLYMHAHKNWTPKRRASTIKNSISGLVIVSKSCGSDISRLTFWWSNVVVLRAIVAIAFDKGLSSVSNKDKAQSTLMANANDNGSPSWARARRSSFDGKFPIQTTPTTPKPLFVDHQESSTYIVALEKLEEWIYSKIVDSLWWQAMIPPMQKDVGASTSTNPKGIVMASSSTLFGSTKEDLSKLAGDSIGIFGKKRSRHSSSLPKLGDAFQGNLSMEVWKSAIVEALRRLCPRRGAGHACSCLPMLIKMAIEGCVGRLDVALFNAILREPGDDVPTNPLFDLVRNSSILPISPGGLTFGGGSQLKNVVVTWSTFIAGLVNFNEPISILDVDNGENIDTSKDFEKVPRFLNLIKETGDLLMLPKDNLMDTNIRKDEPRPEAKKSVDLFVLLRTMGDILQLPKNLIMNKSLRREICPMLSVELIRRILVNFVPDEFAPDPISPSLLAALNAEAEIEKQRHGEVDSLSTSTTMANEPPIIYVAPSVKYVWSWIGEGSVDVSGWGHSNNSLLRKGYTSDEDLTIMEQLQRSSASSTLEFILSNSMQETANRKQSKGLALKRSQSLIEIGRGNCFELLKEVWGTP